MCILCGNTFSLVTKVKVICHGQGQVSSSNLKKCEKCHRGIGGFTNSACLS